MQLQPPNIRDFMDPETVDQFLDLIQLVSASMCGEADEVEARINALDFDERAELLALAVGAISGGVKAAGIDVDALKVS
ncbi:hypothetical protein JOJ86_006035 [Rhodococcus percolatus]|uniref:hypothetical protein n=1 Tax=Rhodococcus opacus TaxID=37919 RepID=UPI0015FD11AC|nr:hypothetical protein [Rhodococcus opacus]MBA8964757.1 hypothetical protein [Rhodococcus opacus]MBP2208309.1 hypothetical protein [Rhodococcus opacus]